MAHRSTSSAYKGRWRHDATGQRFSIFYISGTDAAANRRNDAGPKLAGWYWLAGRNVGARRFQSSRAAWRDARLALAAKSSSETTPKENAA